MGAWDKSKQLHFKRTCGIHNAYVTIDAIQKSKGKTLQCKYCNGEPSSHEVAFMSMVDGLDGVEMGGPPYMATEAKVLKGKFAAADFYFPDHNLAVQVDGEHHFHRSARDDTTEGAGPRDQALRDEQWNKQACEGAKVNVWRVHHLDVTAPSVVLKAILLRAAANKGKPFLELGYGFNKT